MPRIERIIRAVCRRRCLKDAEADDFASIVKLHLIDNDYQVLRSFQGKSSLNTFLHTVIQNQFRDFRIQRWGRWRSSAAARRLGTTAVQLETLLLRDGFTFPEAVHQLQQNHDIEETEDELAEMAAELPVRFQRRFTDDEALARMALPEEPDPVRDQEKAERARKVESAVRDSLAEISDEDRLLLRLRFEEGLMVSRIAKMLNEAQKPLYRRIYGLLKQLRQSLKSARVDWPEAAEALDWQAGELDFSDGPPESSDEDRHNDG